MNDKELELQHDLGLLRERIAQYTITIGEQADEIARLRALAEQAREALEPFADIGVWLFARNLPDDTLLVDVRGFNGVATPLTRGHFKAAHAAAWAIRDPEGSPQLATPNVRRNRRPQGVRVDGPVGPREES